MFKISKLRPIVIYLILSILMFGCSPKHFKSLKSNVIKERDENERDYYLLPLKVAKKTLRTLPKRLSEDFIYIYAPVNHMPSASEHFEVVIYDCQEHKYFTIENSHDYPNDYKINEVTSVSKDFQFILDYYQKGNIAELLNLPELFNSGHIFSNYRLYDSKENSLYEINNLFINNNGEIMNIDDLHRKVY